MTWREMLDEPVPRWMEYAMVAGTAIAFFSTAAYFMDLELLAPLVILLMYRGWREKARGTE